MIAAQHTACILLAAGQSWRFGKADKLATPFHGKALATHAAETLAELPFKHHIAVTSEANADLFSAPFEAHINQAPEKGLASSIAIGVNAVQSFRVQAVLVALADMPMVPLDHFRALLSAFSPEAAIDIVATRNDGRGQVPAIFSVKRCQDLLKLEGDQGARDLLQSAAQIACDPELLVDLDRPEDFDRHC